MWPVKWKKTDPIEKLPNYQLRNSILKFDFLSENDFGEYTCTSFNLFGVAEIKLIISREGLIVTKKNYKPSLRRKLARKKAKRRQRFPIGIELRKSRFRKRTELIKHKFY